MLSKPTVSPTVESDDDPPKVTCASCVVGQDGIRMASLTSFVRHCLVTGNRLISCPGREVLSTRSSRMRGVHLAMSYVPRALFNWRLAHGM